MRKSLLIITLYIGLSASTALAYDRGVFGTEAAPVDTSTLSASADSLVSRIVYWKLWNVPEKFKGTLTLHGSAEMSSGTQKVITVHFWPLYDINDLGKMRTFSETITVPASGAVEIDLNIAGETWYRGCKGFKIALVPDAAGSVILFDIKELSR